MKRVIRAASSNDVYYWNGVDTVPRDVVSVVIEDGVTEIKRSAFNGRSIETVKIPESVVYIGEYAFSECRNLRSIVIPDSVTYLGPGAFNCCTSLEYAKLSNNLDKMRDNTFSCCNALRTIDIPGSVSYIERDSFYWCDSMKTVVLHEGTYGIDSEAFELCENLVSISIPESMKYIHRGAFKGCKRLTDIRLPEGFSIEEAIENGSFSGTPFIRKYKKQSSSEVKVITSLIMQSLQVEDLDAEDYAEVLASKLWNKYKQIPKSIDADNLRDVDATELDIEFETKSATAYLVWEYNDPSRGVFLNRRPAGWTG